MLAQDRKLPEHRMSVFQSVLWALAGSALAPWLLRTREAAPACECLCRVDWQPAPGLLVAETVSPAPVPQAPEPVDGLVAAALREGALWGVLLFAAFLLGGAYQLCGQREPSRPRRPALPDVPRGGYHLQLTREPDAGGW